MMFITISVFLDIMKDNSGKFEQAVLRVVKNDDDKAVITFPSSAKRQSIKWDKLKAKIDKAREQIRTQLYEIRKQTNKQRDEKGLSEPGKEGNKINGGCRFYVNISGNKDSCIVEIHFPDESVVTCSDGKVISLCYP